MRKEPEAAGHFQCGTSPNEELRAVPGPRVPALLDVLLGWRPSLHPLRCLRRLSVALFDGFIGTTAPSDSPLPCVPDCGFRLHSAMGSPGSRPYNFAAFRGSQTTWVRCPA